MDIKDLAGLEQPLTKLIEVTSSAIGTIYEDTLGVNAEVRRQIKLAEAEQEIKLLQVDTENEIINRTQKRLLLQEINRQINIEEIVQGAVEHLPETVTNEKPSKDWTSTFFNIVQDVSEKEIQVLWSKILAGEVAKPGSFSKRTLETLKTLSQDEARTFVKLNTFVFNNYIVFKLGQDTSTLNSFGFTFAEWKVMHEAGLVLISEDLHVTMPTPTPIFPIGQKFIQFTTADKRVVDFQIKQLTRVGIELSRLIEASPDEKYLTALCNYYKKLNVDSVIS